MIQACLAIQIVHVTTPLTSLTWRTLGQRNWRASNTRQRHGSDLPSIPAATVVRRRSTIIRDGTLPDRDGSCARSIHRIATPRGRHGLWGSASALSWTRHIGVYPIHRHPSTQVYRHFRRSHHPTMCHAQTSSTWCHAYMAKRSSCRVIAKIERTRERKREIERRGREREKEMSKKKQERGDTITPRGKPVRSLQSAIVSIIRVMWRWYTQEAALSYAIQRRRIAWDILRRHRKPRRRRIRSMGRHSAGRGAY